MPETRFVSAAGRTGRVVCARLLPGTDFITGLEAACRKHGIKQGSISCSIGSFRRATYCVLVPNEESVFGAAYGPPHVAEGPVELIAGMGVVMVDDQGEMSTHFHAVMCDKEGKAFAGHMVAGGNEALATFDLVITEITGLKMLRRLDEETNLPQFLPQAE